MTILRDRHYPLTNVTVNCQRDIHFAYFTVCAYGKRGCSEIVPLINDFFLTFLLYSCLFLVERLCLSLE